jgi:hypothetical protein
MRLPHVLLAVIALGFAGMAACENDEDCKDTDGDEDCGDDGDENPAATTGTGMMTLSCDGYCSTIMANCAGATAQYETLEDCVAVCASFPEGSAADQSGNTLGCRTYHAGAAENDPGTHCTHAGPGGDGVCGQNCDGYCQIVMASCTGANEVYASEAECQTDCAAHGTDVKYDVSKDSGNQVACLLAHATGAPLVPEDHCVADLNTTSDTCRDGAGGGGGGGGGA